MSVSELKTSEMCMKFLYFSLQTPDDIWTEYLQRLNMSFVPSLASYSYDGTWFLAKALDDVVRNHGLKLENIQTGNETFYDLLTSTLSSVTFTGLTVRILVP